MISHSKYMARGIVVDAFQITKERKDNNVDWPAWMHKAWNEEKSSINAIYRTGETLTLKTEKHEKVINDSDWVIQYINGDLAHYPQEYFEQTFEELI